MRRTVLAAVAALAVCGAAAPTVSAAVPGDDAQVALNIIPSGQYGGYPAPAGATTQAQMYNALTPLFDHVTNADLFRDFKSEAFGITAADGPARVEPVPYPGVAIARDRYDVPHVLASTHDGGVWAAGWIAAEDRLLLLNEARGDAAVAAVDVPGLSALGLVSNLQTFQPSAQTERALARQTTALLRAGAEGRDVLHDIDVYVQGINAYLARHSPMTAPFTRNDVYAFNALKDQFVGEGGGNQAENSQYLGALERRLGVPKGYSVFSDLRQNLNPASPTTVDGTFNYDHDPNRPGAPGSVVLDPRSFRAVQVVPAATAKKAAIEPRPQASNELMVEGRYSATGHPLLVGGPQIGYFYPGLTWEVDMHAPGLDWRGATSAPFPGYMLIGRGPDFATTLTSAGAQQIDEYAETLCGHSRTKYRFRGRCRSMQRFDAGTLNGRQVVYETTVHGPVVGYGRVHGRLVAISRKRSSYGKDALDLLYNRRLSDGQVHSAQSFIKAAQLTPQTFNSFYVDDKHVAVYTAGLLPLRPRGVDPSLLTVGTGRYEWRGFLSAKGHPQGIDPRHTPVRGTMVNWNNTTAHGFGAADDSFGRNGSVARVTLLNDDLRGQRRHGKWTLAGVVSAMNEAATQDVRAVVTVPLLARLLKGTRAPNAQAAKMLALLEAWNRHGGSRLDRTGDGKITDPGAAIMDAAWPRIATAEMRPVLGPLVSGLNNLFSVFDAPPGGQFSGWYQYFDRDVQRLLGLRQRQPFTNVYCGGGNLSRCRRAVWAAITAAGRQLTRKQGTANPAAWRASATAEQITFVPGLLPYRMRYTNRPSGIQQVITFNRHRP